MDRQLLTRLKEYTASDAYPFHMPGHKRRIEFPNPFSIDITEIDGFDNLLHPNGILKESMEWAAGIYGADKTYYLVNGSSSGILSAISATTSPGGTILISRNCHKAVYHGVILNHLKSEYSYPQVVNEYGLLGGLLPGDMEQLLIKNQDIQAVLVVSPTYDGVVSDIREIARVVHSFGLPLIVDEAHGAHFPFGRKPVSALALGADIVIQSVHKTLPSLTQTAVLHVRSGLVDVGKLERYLQIYQSSSPSYVFLSSIESAIAFMQEHGMEQLAQLDVWIGQFRSALSGMKVLRLVGSDLKGRYGVYDFDHTKLLIQVPECARILETGERQLVNGVVLGEILRQEYHLEMEMCGENYVIGIATCMDTQDGIHRLAEALLFIDSSLEIKERAMTDRFLTADRSLPVAAMTIAKAWNSEREAVTWGACRDRVSAEFIYVYPPGIPIVTPGELMTEPILRQIRQYREAGLTVHGGGDYLDCVIKR